MVCRDSSGGVAVVLPDLDGQQQLASRIIELQQRTGCQCVLCSKHHAYLIHQNVMVWELHYYTEEFGKVLARWRENTERARREKEEQDSR